MCVWIGGGGGMVGLSRSLRLQPTDQTRIWEEGSGGGGGGLDAASAQLPSLPTIYKHVNTDQHYYSTKKRGWIASLHFVNIKYTIIHAIFYTNNYLMWIVKDESRITYQDTQHVNTHAAHIMWTIDHV